MELVVLSANNHSARCRLLGSDGRITLRAARPWHTIPGEIVTVEPRKQWLFGPATHLTGKVVSTRLDVAALGLPPLGLQAHDLWDPAEEEWDDDDRPPDRLARALIAWGPRRRYEMEQVLPGTEPDDYSDPVIESNDRKDAGDYVGARRLLMALCDADLRCLDAHAHLGNLAFDTWLDEAVRHYEVGVRIGELSLGGNFDGLLPWSMLDNRPFLRCMSGFALSLWRLNRFKEAEQVYDRLLWLNPGDNQGVRCKIDDVRARVPWKREKATRR